MAKGRLRRALEILGGARVRGGAIATIGYILSPLSWWNDVFVNIPIAYVAASIIALINREYFTWAFVGAYLATNVIGLIMMHVGVENVVRGQSRFTKKDVVKYVVVSVVYTVIVSALALASIIQPPY